MTWVIILVLFGLISWQTLERASLGPEIRRSPVGCLRNLATFALLFIFAILVIWQLLMIFKSG